MKVDYTEKELREISRATLETLFLQLQKHYSEVVDMLDAQTDKADKLSELAERLSDRADYYEYYYKKLKEERGK